MKEKMVCLILVALGITLLINPLTEGGVMFHQQEPEVIRMSYRLEGAYNPYKYIQIDILDTGEGILDYELYKEYVSKDQPAKNILKFEIEKEEIEALLQLYQETDFFNIEIYDLNKDRIRVTDVGTTALILSYGGKERKLSYGYIENDPFRKLIIFYWHLIEKHLPRK